MLKANYLKENMHHLNSSKEKFFIKNDLWSSRFLKDVMKKSFMQKIVKEKQPCTRETPKESQKSSGLKFRGRDEEISRMIRPELFNSYDIRDLKQTHSRVQSLNTKSSGWFKNSITSSKDSLRQLMDKCETFVTTNRTDRNWLDKKVKE